MPAKRPRPTIPLLVAALSLLSLALAPCLAKVVEVKIIEDGVPLKLDRHEMLGVERSAEGCFAPRSAEPGTADEFGSHSISIATLADVIQEPGDLATFQTK